MKGSGSEAQILQIYPVATVLGVSTLLAALPLLRPAIQVAGGALLLHLGCSLVRQAMKTGRPPKGLRMKAEAKHLLTILFDMPFSPARETQSRVETKMHWVKLFNRP